MARQIRAQRLLRVAAILERRGDDQAAYAGLHYAHKLDRAWATPYLKLGNWYLRRGQAAAARDWYQAGLEIKPDFSDLHANLGAALGELGQVQLAWEHYQTALALEPERAVLAYNFAVFLQDSGQPEAAVVYYRHALRQQHDYTAAWYNLGLTLQALGDHAEAGQALAQAVALEPNDPVFLNSLGVALRAQGELDAALAYFQRALGLNSHLASTHHNLGVSYAEQGQLVQARSHYLEAIALDPHSSETYFNLGLLYHGQGNTAAARACFAQCDPRVGRHRRHQLLLLPILYDDPAEIAEARSQFMRGLDELTASIPDHKQALEIVACQTNFYLSYQDQDDTLLQSQYGTWVTNVMGLNFPNYTQKLTLSDSSGRIRIGYISCHLRAHSGGKWLLGWLKNHDRQTFEIFCYHTGKLDYLTPQFIAHCDHFYHLPQGLVQVADQVLADQIEILIYTDLGMTPSNTQLAGLRLAPTQCTAWGHPVTSGLPTIDYFFSGDLSEPPQADQHYTEQLVRLPGIGICYEQPSMPVQERTRADFGLGEQDVVYLCCQSLFKYLPQDDCLWAALVERVPEARLIFVADVNPGLTAKFLARLERSFGERGLDPWIRMLPRQGYGAYFDLLRVADVFLDSLGFGAGHTGLEALACGLPVVTLPGQFLRGRQCYGFLRQLGVTETVAVDRGDYVDLAVRLGRDPVWREQLRQKIVASQGRLFGDSSGLRGLEAFYRQVVGR